VNTRNVWGQTALIVAARDTDGEIIDFLLEEGAHIDAQDSSGTTALMVAAKHGRFHTVSRLLAEGADPTLKDNFGHDALLHSKHSGCYNTTTILVEVAEAVKVYVHIQPLHFTTT